jgi:hypothetical protein
MPNKYEREIEEILRNMDRPEPKQGLGNRIRAFNRPRPRRPRRVWEIGLSACEVFLLSGIVLILLAAGIKYFYGGNQPGFLGRDALSGWVALLGFALFVVGLIIGWRRGFSRGFNSGRASTPSWRGSDTQKDLGGDGKVVRLQTRHSRNPFTALTTQLRILRLKLRYQRIRDHIDGEQ